MSDNSHYQGLKSPSQFLQIFNCSTFYPDSRNFDLFGNNHIASLQVPKAGSISSSNFGFG
jgi:hypothetical protein